MRIKKDEVGDTLAQYDLVKGNSAFETMSGGGLDLPCPSCSAIRLVPMGLEKLQPHFGGCPLAPLCTLSSDLCQWGVMSRADDTMQVAMVVSKFLYRLPEYQLSAVLDLEFPHGRGLE